MCGGQIPTLDLDGQTGSEAGPDGVEGGAEELPGVVGPHHDPRLRAVDAGLAQLDPGDGGEGGGVRDQTVHGEKCLLVGVLE